MFIRRELGETGTGCLFQFTYCDNELYIKLRTQLVYCCVGDKTFTSLNIVKHVESSFEKFFYCMLAHLQSNGGTGWRGYVTSLNKQSRH